MAMNTRQSIGTIMGDLAGAIGKIGDLINADEECKLDAPLIEDHHNLLDGLKKEASDIYKKICTIYSSRDESKSLHYQRKEYYEQKLEKLQRSIGEFDKLINTGKAEGELNDDPT